MILRTKDNKFPVTAYSLDGENVSQIENTDKKATKGQIWRGIAIDRRRDLFVLPNSDGFLIRMSRDDGVIKDITKVGVDIREVCYTLEDDIYILSECNTKGANLVIVNADNLEIVKTIKHEMIANPSMVTVGSRHGICVNVASDRQKNCLLVFDMEGNVIRTYGPDTGELGKLDKPTGVCMDSSGRILVCDHDNTRILAVWSDDQTDHWECLLNCSLLDDKPMTVAVDNESRNLVVTSYKSVQVFNL